MIPHNLHNGLDFKKATNVIIDMADYVGCEWVVIGASAGNQTLTIEHGEAADLSDAVAVPAAELGGTAVVAIEAGSLTGKVGYRGTARYIRANHGSLVILAVLKPRIR